MEAMFSASKAQDFEYEVNEHIWQLNGFLAKVCFLTFQGPQFASSKSSVLSALRFYLVLSLLPAEHILYSL